MDSREEIKAKLPIFDLVSKYVELKKAGRNFRGLCPFHNEKTPSFMVSPEKDIAYCFGCHKGGDIFAFYQGVEGVDFPEALKALGEMVGVEVETQSPVISKEVSSRKSRLIDIHEVAAQFYTECLLETGDGKKVLKYLYGRGLNDETIKEFKLGFAPDSFDKAYKFLMKKGYDKDEIVESGLATTRDTDFESIFDRFRLRLMFPVFNKNGDVVAFGGRALKNEESAKYLNSPDTPIYHKGDVLYGFSHAKDHIRKNREVLVVEGYFDQLMCYQAGFKNVVAVSGTAMTQKHLSLLKRYADTILFALDSDSAGREALYRSAELAYEADFNVKVVDFSGYKDPADVIKNDTEIFNNFISGAKEFFEFMIYNEFLSVDESIRFSLSNVQKFLSKVLPIVNRIDSSISKDLVIRKLSQHLMTKVDFLYDELNNLKTYSVKSVKGGSGDAIVQKYNFDFEDYFWCHILTYPQVYGKIRDLIIEKPFVVREIQVYKSVEDFYNSSDDFGDILINDLDVAEDLKNKYRVLTLYLESVTSEGWDQEAVTAELKRLLDRMLKSYKKTESERIQRALNDGSIDLDKDLRTQLLSEKIRIESL